MKGVYISLIFAFSCIHKSQRNTLPISLCWAMTFFSMQHENLEKHPGKYFLHNLRNIFEDVVLYNFCPKLLMIYIAQLRLYSSTQF